MDQNKALSQGDQTYSELSPHKPQHFQAPQTTLETETQSSGINIHNQECIYPLEEQQEPRNYGKLIPLFKDQFHHPKFILGPHYFIFIPTVILCSWFLKYCLEIFYTKLYFDTFSMIVCALASVFFIVSYIRVGVSDPGVASKTVVPSMGIRLERGYCRPCKVLRTDETRHCYYCDVCILEMDHHCVWVGKCIGKNNWTLFKVFLFSVILNLVVFASCIIVSARSAQSVESKL